MRHSLISEACQPAPATLGAVAEATEEIHAVARIIENVNESFANTYGRLAGSYPTSGECSSSESPAPMGELGALKEAVARVRRAANENSDFVGRFGSL